MNQHTIAAPLNAMRIKTETTSSSKNGLWAGRILSGCAILFLVMDGTMKLFKPHMVVEATVQLGFPESSIVGIGMVLLLCTTLYVIPRTAIFGAVLLTGYLGGAVASQVRVSGPLFNIVFPVLFGCCIWGGLWLRDRRVQAVLTGKLSDSPVPSGRGQAAL
jgi:hypothetical protein